MAPGPDEGEAGLFADSAVPSSVEKEPPHYHGHRERLREKFATGALHPVEMVAALKRKNEIKKGMKSMQKEHETALR